MRRAADHGGSRPSFDIHADDLQTGRTQDLHEDLADSPSPITQAARRAASDWRKPCIAIEPTVVKQACNCGTFSAPRRTGSAAPSCIRRAGRTGCRQLRAG
jgi:hypothetical protein